MVIEESGDSLAALQHLEHYNDQICDKLALMESKGMILFFCLPLRHDFLAI